MKSQGYQIGFAFAIRWIAKWVLWKRVFWCFFAPLLRYNMCKWKLTSDLKKSDPLEVTFVVSFSFINTKMLSWIEGKKSESRKLYLPQGPHHFPIWRLAGRHFGQARPGCFDIETNSLRVNVLACLPPHAFCLILQSWTEQSGRKVIKPDNSASFPKLKKNW